MTSDRFIVAVSALLLSCAGAPPSLGTEDTAWSFYQGDVLLHAPSRARFPSRYGELLRRDHKSYDRIGLNASVAYERLEPRLLVTVFVYAVSEAYPDLLEEFKRSVQGVARAMGATVQYSDSLSIRRDPEELDGYLARLNSASPSESFVSWVALVRSGEWYYKAQATAPINRADAVEESASAAVVILQDVVFGDR